MRAAVRFAGYRLGVRVFVVAYTSAAPPSPGGGVGVFSACRPVGFLFSAIEDVHDEDDQDMRGNPLALPAPPGYEQAQYDLAVAAQRGEITFEQAKKRWRRILRRHRKDQTIQTLAAHLRRQAVLVRSSLRQTAIRPMVAHGFTRVVPRGRGRTRRVVRLAAHGPPGRPRPSDDDPPSHELARQAGASA